MRRSWIDRDLAARRALVIEISSKIEFHASKQALLGIFKLMPPTSDLLIESEIISVRRTEQVNQKLDLHVQNRRKNTLSKKRLNQ